MSVKLCCCLCFTACANEYQYLQNDLGECNEIYEITVKYFDPMLLTDYITNACSQQCNILCQDCWAHIQEFHDFQQTVINTRSSLEQVNMQNSSMEIKGDRLAVDFHSDNNTNNLEDDFEMFNDSDEEFDEDEPLHKLRKSYKSNRKINNGKHNKKTNTLDKKTHRVRKSKVSSTLKSKIVSSEGNKEEGNAQRKQEHLKDLAENAGIHPALDKGRKYDKFIAEWKSQLECDICNEVFPIFDLLKAHFKNIHNTRGFVKCCDRKFDRRCSLVEHIRLHINPEMHKCDICGKISGSKYSLIHHKKTIHEESEKFKCNECPKIFKQKQNLKCHLLTHVTGNRDFKCKECDKAYVLELQLKKHIKLVHIDNRICDQCGKTLHGIGALKNHLKEHADIEKPKYPCDECGAELGSRITLKRHKASYHNDGSTVYICSLCGKVSSTERALKNHKKYVHEIERKYKCPHCDKAFKRSQNLQEHIATHTGEALYQCPQCPRSFKINSKYHEHRKKAHPIEWEAGRKNRIEKQKIDYGRVTNQVVL